METKDLNIPVKQEEELPSLLAFVHSREVSGFDLTPTSTGENPSFTAESAQPIKHHHAHSISISMPSSPLFRDQHTDTDTDTDNLSLSNEISFTNSSTGLPPRKPHAVKFEQRKTRFHSQPMPQGNHPSMANNNNDNNYYYNTNNIRVFDAVASQQRRLRDNRYDSFKTWSGKLERQISNLRGKPQELTELTELPAQESARMPKVERFFDALEGPELDRLKESEQLILPEDKKWPFLLRFPINAFGICLGVSSQAILWKTLATSPSTQFLHITPLINLVLWFISTSLVAILSLIYVLKIVFYFEAVRREYHHPIRVNFFFAPWIACLFLVIGLPQSIFPNPHQSLWYVLMTPILCLELKIYGQWMSGGQRRLSKVANPSNHLSIVGNFVGALLGASMGIKEGPIFFFAVGVAHYTVLFVTLYQRLPTNETLPKELHPVFFLFVAAPSVACMAWANITGEFAYGSRLAYFIALFLYASLGVRINFFRGFRFSLAWWAYTFPMTGAAIATIRYSSEVKNLFTQSLSVTLSVISTLTVTALLLSTMIHAFVLHDLFPNDISIAITHKRSTEGNTVGLEKSDTGGESEGH